MSAPTRDPMAPDDINDHLGGPAASEPVRMTTDVERMLAVIVDHHQAEIATLRYVLSGVLQRLGMEQFHDLLYVERTTSEGDTYLQGRQPLIWPWYLRQMAKSSDRSLAQVAGSTERAAELLASLDDWRSSR